VRETSAIGGGCLLGFAIVWNLFCAPLWFLVRWQWPMDAQTLLMAAFPIAGLLLLLATAYQFSRRRKYGVSVCHIGCHIDRVPIPLGATLRGELDVRLREMPPGGLALRLACVRRTVMGSGKNRSVRETVLWQDEQTVTHGAMPSPNGSRRRWESATNLRHFRCDYMHSKSCIFSSYDSYPPGGRYSGCGS